MATIHVPNTKSPVSERQIARILARGLVSLNILKAHLEGEALAANNGPALSLEAVNPDGSVVRFIVEVRTEDV